MEIETKKLVLFRLLEELSTGGMRKYGASGKEEVRDGTDSLSPLLLGKILKALLLLFPTPHKLLHSQSSTPSLPYLFPNFPRWPEVNQPSCCPRFAAIMSELAILMISPLECELSEGRSWLFILCPHCLAHSRCSIKVCSHA